MLNRADIIAFVATTKPERARVFYEDALGLALIAERGIIFERYDGLTQGEWSGRPRVEHVSPGSRTRTAMCCLSHNADGSMSRHDASPSPVGEVSSDDR
jgi:hypothetical protein